MERIERANIAVTALDEGRLVAPVAAVVGAPADEIRTLVGSDSVEVTVTVFAVESDGQVLLVDAGMGPDSPLGGLASSMAAAAIAPDHVDTVVLTHLHPDHANGLLTDPFPNARVLVSRAEADFVRAGMPGASDYVRHDYRSAAAVLAAIDHRLDYIEDADPASLDAEWLPGHAAGHAGFRLRMADGFDIVFVGDLIHAPAVQGPRPQLSVIVGDLDPVLAARTRRRVLAAAADAGTILAGAHLGPDGFYTVARDGDGFRLEPYA